MFQNAIFYYTDGHPGTEFVVSFLQNRPILSYPVARIYMTTLSTHTVTVTLRIPGTENGRFWAPSESEEASGYSGGYRKILTLNALNPVVHEFPTDIHLSGLSLEDKGSFILRRVIFTFQLTIPGVYITASKEITVHVASVNGRSSDMHLALPVDTWGTEYYVLSMLFRGEAKFPQGPSQFAVISYQDDTDVIITLPDMTNLRGSPPADIEVDGRDFSLTMDAFHTFQVS
jgi:hypothetical protein